MFLELARPVSLLASVISLLAVFHAAFLGSEGDVSQRIWNSVGMLLLAAGVSLIGGLVFQGRAAKASGGDELRLFASFPVRVFCWAAGMMAVLFVLAWWVGANCYLRPVVRFWRFRVAWSRNGPSGPELPFLPLAVSARLNRLRKKRQCGTFSQLEPSRG